MNSHARGQGPLYNVAEAVAEIRAWRDETGVATTRAAALGVDLADEIRKHATSTSDAAMAGHTLVIAAAALTELVRGLASFGGRPSALGRQTTEILNVAALAGLTLIEQAQAETDADDSASRGYM